MTAYPSIEAYIESIPEDKKEAFIILRKILKDKLPQGFNECLSYNMLGYVVPKDLYEKGYHCDPTLPLPFINLAAQKNHIALYHMGLYADKTLLDWFTKAYKERCTTKLDMGKSCIRFKKPDQIPFDLIGELVQKMSVKDWIDLYETTISV